LLHKKRVALVIDQPEEASVTANHVNMGSGLFPGDFTGCATNETGASMAYTEFIGKGRCGRLNGRGRPTGA
jgi:hypothetical protein